MPSANKYPGDRHQIEKFVSDALLDPRFFKPLDRFDIKFARTMWVYDNVRARSQVLHLACGVGMLALLKRKGIKLYGLDASAEFALAARRNGYDAAFHSQLSSFPFADASFDYAVSLEEFSNLAKEERLSALSEVKRVLRPGGVALFVIEDRMTTDKSLEREFQRVFQYVVCEPRHTLCLSSEDFLNWADQSRDNFEYDFLEYLRSLSFKERRAFDIAMGYVFAKVSDLDLGFPEMGCDNFLVKASDAPLGPFYNEHRDRGALVFSRAQNEFSTSRCLDRNQDAVFDDGWYSATLLPPVARWMGKVGRIQFRSAGISAISLDLTTHQPNLSVRPLGLQLLLNGVPLSSFKLFRYGWLELRVSVPESVSFKSSGQYELELRADCTYQPNHSSEDKRDDREMSVAVCNIVVHR